MSHSSSTSSFRLAVSEDLRPLGVWALTLGARFVPLFGVAFALLWMGRSSGSTGLGLEDRVADSLLTGRDVTGLPTCDTRLVQRRYIAGLRERKDVVVIASSRGFMIQHTLFPGKSFFNSSVGAANLEDLLAIYSMYRRAGFTPGVILLGVEPWMFKSAETIKADLGVLPWALISQEVDDGLRLLHPERRDSVASRLGRFILPSWFSINSIRQSLVFLVRRHVAPPVPLHVTYRADGSVLDAGLRHDRLAVRAMAADFDKGDVQNFLRDPRTSISAERLRLFEDILRLMKSDGVSVQLFLASFHPVAWDLVRSSERYRALPVIEQAVLELGRRLALPVFGSYDPAICGVEEDDFSDPIHLFESGIQRVLSCRRLPG